ncbi:SDR family oxidoreductase [Streptomyces aureocirculatus]|uniref:SDR family oxidoreductase n=1 Tax=Streptomyces aureocirculatus TaxID=67275 RepID=UPI0004C507BF|nr:SDR family oxidoreductase [Streptomyces aureocirculatus]
MSILITGATGFLGSRLARELLARPGDQPLIILGRGGEKDLRTRTEAAITWLDAPPLPPGALDRLRFFSTDLSQPGMALTAAQRVQLADGLTQIWHSAAALSLEGDPVPLHRTNVMGTRHVLELADAAPGAHVVHVSTIAVAGRRTTGHILEDDLRDDGFLTSYEETKYTAETIVHTWARTGARPATIMRPSLLVSHRPAPHGLPGQPLDTLVRLTDDTARSWTMRGRSLADILANGWEDGTRLHVRIPVDPQGAWNMLQVDYAAHAMVRAAEIPHDTPLVQTLHITHPKNTATTTLFRALELRHPGVALDLVPELPAPTSLEQLVMQRASFLGYAAQRRTYDRSQLMTRIGELPDPKPVDEHYLAQALGTSTTTAT